MRCVVGVGARFVSIALVSTLLVVGAAGGVAHADTNFGMGCAEVGAALTGGTFHPVTPARLLDSRTSVGGWSAPLGPGASRNLAVRGAGPVPAEATAIVGELTITNGSTTSAIALWPAGAAMPAARVFGFIAGATITETAAVAIGTGGSVTFGNDAGSVDVIFDVQGYYAPAGAPCADVAPVAAYFNSALGPAATDSITVTGANVPVTATAVVVRVDVTTATANTYLTIYPAGTSAPPMSELIVGAGATVRSSNVVAVAIGTAGQVNLLNSLGSVGVTVTVLAYFDPTAVGAIGAGGGLSVTPAFSAGPAPLTVTATSTAGLGTFVTYDWDWGDGSTHGSGITATHTYSGGSPGEFRIRLTATTVTVSFVGDFFVAAAAGPPPGAGYHPLVPTRILDSRTFGTPQKLTAGAPRFLVMTGTGGPANIPPSSSAVVMNVTATNPDSGSYLTVWPSGSTPPISSNLNFGPGETIPNLVTTRLPADGKIYFSNAVGAVDVVVDVVGYYDNGSGGGDLFNPITPLRLLDSRTSTGGWGGALDAATPLDLAVRQPTRPDGVPATATSIVANVTVTGSDTNSYLSVWPTGVSRPNVSNLNFGAGETIANLVVVGIGASDAVRFANANGKVHVVVDVVGYFDPTTGSRFHALDPVRVLDDRIGQGLPGAWGPHQSRTFNPNATGLLPKLVGATAIVANVTATQGTAGSFVTVYPGGATRPNASNLNFGADETIPNLVTVGLSPSGDVEIYNELGNVDLVADLVGYYAPT